jgi:hypothetical protein
MKFFSLSKDRIHQTAIFIAVFLWIAMIGFSICYTSYNMFEAAFNVLL